jgi:3'-phosphoadenosine 5'-phosphosulfate (PAPS) 3'-phosphatase
VRDTVNLAQQGVPVIGLIHQPFEKLARMQAIQLGMPDAPLFMYSQDLPSKDSADLVQKKAEDIAEQAISIMLGQHGDAK